MDIDFNDIKVGDNVFYVPSDRWDIKRNIEVTKVGRKYFYCGYKKVNKTNGFVGDEGRTQCFRSEEQYNQIIAMQKEIADLRRELEHKASSLPLEKLKRIHEIINE